MVYGLGFGVQGFRVWGSGTGFGVHGLGRALDVCPDAIRSHVRITHVLHSFEAFEGSESGHKNPSGFTWALQHANCLSCQAAKSSCVFSPLCAVFCVLGAHCVFTESVIFIPVVDGPKL